MAGALVALLGASAAGGGGMGGFTVNASPLSAIGSGSSAADIDVTTNDITATPVGATAPYTYAWTEVSSSAVWTILSPTASTTRFRAVDVPGNSSATAVFLCTVTDSRGRTGTVEVTAEAYNFGGF